MDLLLLKVLIMLCIILTTALGLILPLLLSICDSRIIGFGSSFSGGVFISIGILHLLPEGARLLEKSLNTELPLGYFTVLLGYFIVLFLDRVAFDNHNLISHGKGHVDLGHHSTYMTGYEEEVRFKHIVCPVNRFTVHLESGTGEKCRILCDAGNSYSIPLLETEQGQEASKLSVLVLAAMLSLHSVFEGVALGLQRTSYETMSLGAALVAHKLPEVLALVLSSGGLQTFKHNVFLLSVFGVATPVGICIGILFSSFTSATIEGIFLCLSTGTFLYIGGSEMIIKEFSVSKDKNWKFLALVIGVFCITGLLLCSPHTVD